MPGRYYYQNGSIMNSLRYPVDKFTYGGHGRIPGADHALENFGVIINWQGKL